MRSGDVTAAFLAGISVPGVSRSNGDLSELIRNPPCSIFVLMLRIVKRMNSDSRRTWQASLRYTFLKPCLADPLGSISAEDEPYPDGFPEPSSLPSGEGRVEGACFARGQKQSRLIAAPITRVSNPAEATFNYEQFGYVVVPTFAPLNPARTGCLLLDSIEVRALRLNDVGVQVRD